MGQIAGGGPVSITLDGVVFRAGTLRGGPTGAMRPATGRTAAAASTYAS